MIRFALSAFGSLWLLSGLLSFHVCTTIPRDPSKPPEEVDAARWVLLVWGIICLILLGPIGLSATIELRSKRRRALDESTKIEKGPVT